MTETQTPPIEESPSFEVAIDSSDHQPFEDDSFGFDEPALEDGSGPRHRARRSERTAGRTIHVPDIPYLRVAGFATTGVGVLIVLFLVYLLVFTPITASRNQQQLAHTLSGQKQELFSLVAGHIPADGHPVAILEIPALQLRQVVVEGTSAADLMNGPGLLPGSSLPGSPGNAVIAGRRVTFGGAFGALPQLRRGDRLVVVDGAGSFTYRVRRTFTVTAGQRDVVTPTLQNRLTLVTSDSSLVTSGRFVVQGSLVGHAVVVPTASAVGVPSYDLGLSGDPVAGGLAVLWTLLSLLVIVAAVVIAWRWGRVWLVYIFAMPVFIACGLFACESVARALPATF